MALSSEVEYVRYRYERYVELSEGGGGEGVCE